MKPAVSASSSSSSSSSSPAPTVSTATTNSRSSSRSTADSADLSHMALVTLPACHFGDGAHSACCGCCHVKTLCFGVSLLAAANAVYVSIELCDALFVRL